MLVPAPMLAAELSSQQPTIHQTERDARDASWPPFVCPSCHGPLASVADGSALQCPGGHTVPVRDGIPRFVPEDNYAAAFGEQWKTFRRTQLDSHTGTTITRDRSYRCLGQGLVARLQAGEPIRILEVGCGAGRFTEVLLGTGAIVTSVDLSSAVEANQENFPQNASHRIAQCDVNALPFAPHQFDVVFCLGVVQHTPDPERTIAKLYEHVRPGGELVIDHYPLAPGEYVSLQPLFRALLKRLPPGAAMPWVERLVKLFLPLHARVRQHRLAQSMLARVSPVLSYYGELPLTAAQHADWALLDTHDAPTDWYKHRRSPRQLSRAVEGLGACDVWCARGGNGVELRCRRPAADRPSRADLDIAPVDRRRLLPDAIG